MGKTNFTPFSNMEAASFCSQMAIILKSGISSIEGITIMLDEAQHDDEKQLLTQMQETLLQTGSLHESMANTNVFPSYLLNMVQIGEQTGKLDDVMDSLGRYYEKEANLAQTLKNAVTYPLIMLAMMILVILVLITKVMPVFNQVFEQLGTQMTGFSRVILHIGTFINTHAIIFIGILVVVVAAVIFLLKSSKGQKIFRSLLDKFSNSRELSQKISAYRFSNGMALTLSSGLTPEDCLALTAELTEQASFRSKLDKCRASISQGGDLCETLLENGIFSGTYARMATIASRTGVLDEVMGKIAAQYEEDIDARISGLIAAIEPTLVIILSVIVGVILLSVMLPLMGIMAGL